VQLGDLGKCGRDCAYYACQRLGQQITLNEVDDLLTNKKDVSFSDMRHVFETRGLFCKSFSFDVKTIDSLRINLSSQKMCVIAALPDSVGYANHFVIVVECNGTFLTVYDIAKNKSGIINIANFKGSQINLPALIVTTHHIRYKTISYIDLFVFACSVGVLLFLAKFIYSRLSPGQFKRMLVGIKTLVMSYLTYRLLLTIDILIATVLILVFSYCVHALRKNPIMYTESVVELGDIELFSRQEILFAVQNRSWSAIPISDVQVSCSCLKIEEFPKVIEAQKTQHVKIALVPLLEGRVTYQALVVPSRGSPIIGRVSYNGFQRAKILPKYLNVGMISQGEGKDISCNFSLNNLREEYLLIKSIKMQGGTPIFKVETTVPM
jgi:hypothetical protein